MANTSKFPAVLVSLGEIVERLHFGPNSRFWWEFKNVEENLSSTFPIRLGLKTRTILNSTTFYITVQVSTDDKPEYYCESGNIFGVATSSSTAINTVYKKLYPSSSTRYSGHIVMGLDNSLIIKRLQDDVSFYPFTVNMGDFDIFVYGLGLSNNQDWGNAGNEYKSSIIHKYQKSPAVFVSKIEEDRCHLLIYQNGELKKSFTSTTPNQM